MKKVYIASPVRAVLDFWGKDEEKLALDLISAFASKGCIDVKNLGHTPLSPVLAFSGVYSEYEERERIDQACEELLLSCDAIYVVKTAYNRASQGIARELEIAQRHGISVLYVKEENHAS